MSTSPVFIAVVFRFRVHAGKLGQVTRFDQYMVFFCYYLLGCDTAMPGRLHARLCHAFPVLK